MNIKKTIIFLSTLLVISVTIFAHPHVWIDSRIEIKNNTMYVKWSFDQNYSFTILNDCDTNFDDKFSSKETSLVYKNYFSNLGNHNYFMKLKINRNQINIEPKDFKVVYDIDSERIYYTFKLDLTGKIHRKSHVFVKFKDPSNYIAYQLDLASLSTFTDGIENVQMNFDDNSLEFDVK